MSLLSSLTGGDLLSAGGGIFSSMANLYGANRQMRWQQHMSGSAHQREVADLLAAGLNPILSATGGPGASTPAGAMATVDNPLTDMASGMRTKARLDKLEIPRLKKDMAEAEARINMINQQGANLVESQSTQRHEQALMRDQMELTQANAALARANAKSVIHRQPRLDVEDQIFTEASDALRYSISKAKDFLGIGSEPKRHTSPGDTYGKGRGNVFGGQNKAKIPWYGTITRDPHWKSRIIENLKRR